MHMHSNHQHCYDTGSGTIVRRRRQRQRRIRYFVTMATTTTLYAMAIAASRRCAVVSGWSSSSSSSAALPGRHCYSNSRILSSFLGKKATVARSLMATTSSSNSESDIEGGDDKKKQRGGNTSKTSNNNNNNNIKKFKVADQITAANIDKLAAAFDEMARKEGFDESLQYFANDATFEDEFDETTDDFDDDDDDDEDALIEDDVEINMVDAPSSTIAKTKNDDDLLLNPMQFRLSDFTDDGADHDDEDDDEEAGTISFGNDNRENEEDEEDDMNARLAAARNDMVTGRVSVPKQLDRFAETISSSTVVDLSVLGFRKEADPYGIDETPRKKQFHLVTDALVCSACGADFQSSNEHKPGYLPPEKFGTQVKLAKLEELQRLQLKAENNAADWSAEDEIEWLIQTSVGSGETGGGGSGATTTKSTTSATGGAPITAAAAIDIPVMAEQMGLDLEELATRKKIICKRCHGLQNFGRVEDVLRPGWTEEPLLSQQKFRDLLRPIREKPAVIIALVDLFDFSGSVLPELDNIAGDENPVILAANKADLLPAKMGQVRAENWVRRELEYLGIRSLANIGGSVRLVSCKTGAGIGGMLAKARGLAEEMDCDIYVVGAANAGKSTLLNHILGYGYEDDDNSNSKEQDTGKLRAGNRNKRKGAVTTSPLPGTTLKFIKVDLGGGRSLYDTPGLLVPGTLTQLLTPDELKIVVPKSQVEPITFRVSSGKAVLVGGLAKVELIGDCKPFLFTFFVANGIKLHPTDSSRADEFIQKHAGEMLVPPLGGPERLAQLGEFETHVIDVEGSGWKEAAADITLTGLGWVAVTGAGTATVKISVPKGVGVSLRPPLMPFDIWDSTARYTGSRAVRKSTKTKYGKKRSGVGRN